MNRVQKFVTVLLPARWAADMERESRSWMARCENCGETASIWDRGGIRWKAAGRPRAYGKCRACGRNAWHTITREQSHTA